MNLKILLKSNPIIYSIHSFNQSVFLNSYRNQVVSNTTFCVEGYPSSGNTFFQYIMHYLFPDVNFAHHTHSLATIKIAKRRNLPTVILIRKPLDVISSRAVRFGDDIDLSLKEFIYFYNYIKKNSNIFFVITFEEVTNGDFHRLKTYLDFKGYKFNETLTSEAMEYARNVILYKEKNEKFVALPSEDKEKKKRILKQKVESSIYYLQAVEVYNDIIKKL